MAGEQRSRLSQGASSLRGVAPKGPGEAIKISVGDQIVHPNFGRGMILSAKPMGNDTLLEIAFDNVGTKKLMANYARLEKG